MNWFFAIAAFVLLLYGASTVAIHPSGSFASRFDAIGKTQERHEWMKESLERHVKAP